MDAETKKKESSIVIQNKPSVNFLEDNISNEKNDCKIKTIFFINSNFIVSKNANPNCKINVLLSQDKLQFIVPKENYISPPKISRKSSKNVPPENKGFKMFSTKLII